MNENGTDVLLHRIDDVKEAIPDNVLIKKKVDYVEKFRLENHAAVKHARMYHVPQVVKKLPISPRLYSHKEKEPPQSPVSIPKWRKWNKHDGIIRKKLTMELEPRPQQSPPPSPPPPQPVAEASPRPNRTTEMMENARLIASLHRKNLMSKFISLWVQRWYRTALARASSCL